MIVVVDYGVGNLLSVSNMLRKAGGEVLISNNPSDVLAADRVLLPGVGSFDYGMKMLNSSGIRDALDEYALHLRRPILGICLGAQILGKGSEEGNSEGLGWINMACQRLPTMPGVRVPHMGWNSIKQKKPSSLLRDTNPKTRFYFVHSYHMNCENPGNVLSTTIHGIEFTSAVQMNNIFGVQFHPEKSLRHGLALMHSFVNLEAE